VSPALSAIGDLTAIARGNRIEVYGVAGGELRRTVDHTSRITTVRFASQGHALVAGSEDGTLLVVRDDGAEAVRISVGKAALDVAEFLPDGRVVTVDADRRLVVLDIEGRVRVAEATAPSRVGALRVSSDGRRLVTIPSIYLPLPPVLWDVSRVRVVASLEGHGSQVYSARFVRDDREILTAGTDGTARLWDSETGQQRQTFFARSILLADAVLSPDGSMVIAGDLDGMLRFWDAASGAALWTLRAHKRFISGVHFEGDALVSRGAMGELTRWEIPRASAVGSSIERFDRLVRCGPLRFDEATGGLVTQSPPVSCRGPL
jgi:WD40 repeat protein